MHMKKSLLAATSLQQSIKTATLIIALFHMPFVSCGTDTLSNAEAKRLIEKIENDNRRMKILVNERLVTSELFINKENILNLVNNGSEYMQFTISQENYYGRRRSYIERIVLTEKGKPFVDYDSIKNEYYVEYFKYEANIISITEPAAGHEGIACYAYYKLQWTLNELGEAIGCSLPQAGGGSVKAAKLVKMQDGWRVMDVAMRPDLDHLDK